MSDNSHFINLNHARHAGHQLENLLHLLYPPPPNPDIITLEDVLTRYRLTGLGAPAITAIQQAQRILRATKDFNQIGLCEFHIGLIYLHWGHCLAAVQQFIEARRQWLFCDEKAAVSLSFFAQGQAQHLALHYESAMGAYHRTDQWLSRMKAMPSSAQYDDFIPELTDLLKETQTILRDKMRPPDTPEQITAPPTPEPTPQVSTITPPQETDPPSPEHIISEMLTPQEDLTDPSLRQNVPPPIIFPTQISPTPALITTREFYAWYRVGGRQGDFLPFVQEGEWILVDTRNRSHYELNDLIIIGGKQEELNGSIPVYQTPRPTRIGLLTRLQATSQIPFERDIHTGRVTLVLDTGQDTVKTDNILGVVVGFWLTSLQAGLDETQQKRGFLG